MLDCRARKIVFLLMVALPGTLGSSCETATLRDTGAVAGKLVGAAVFPWALLHDPDPRYREILAREFNYVTPEGGLRWDDVQQDPSSWDFSHADAIVDFAETHGQEVKGHVLVFWYNVPEWAEPLPSPAFRSALKSWIQTAVGRYRGRIRAWDVVNEAVDRNGLIENVFHEKLGPDYIRDAFHWAHEADPDALLFYNETIDRPGAQSEAAFRLLEGLLEEGVPVHGIGFQAHLSATDPPTRAEVAGNIERFGQLGLSVNVSEMDVQIAHVDAPFEERLLLQKEIYEDMAAACAARHACEAITFWGFTDRYSWIDYVFGPDDPLMFDEEYQRKPAWGGILSGLMGFD